MVLIFDEQSAWLYPSVHQSILLDFEDGYPSLSVKAAIIGLEKGRFHCEF